MFEVILLSSNESWNGRGRNFLGGAITLCDRVFGRGGRSLGYQRSGLEKRAVLVLLPYLSLSATSMSIMNLPWQSLSEFESHIK